MNETVEIKGAAYRIGDMDAMMAFHVSRRLAPITEGLVAAFRAAKEGSGDTVDALRPVAIALAEMPDDQANYVIRNCLSHVTRDMGNDKGWTRVMSRTGELMFDDIDMATMLTLTWKVLEVALKDFFSAMPSLSDKLKGLTPP